MLHAVGRPLQLTTDRLPTSTAQRVCKVTGVARSATVRAKAVFPMDSCGWFYQRVYAVEDRSHRHRPTQSSKNRPVRRAWISRGGLHRFMSEDSVPRSVGADGGAIDHPHCWLHFDSPLTTRRKRLNNGIRRGHRMTKPRRRNLLQTRSRRCFC